MSDGGAARERAPSQRAAWGLETFRIGIALGGARTSGDWRAQLALAERADALGFHSLWLPEMHFAPGVTASPLLAHAAFAARTKRIRLATTSLLLPIHEPVSLADEVAALDRASRGRVVLGLGRGFREPLFRAFGVDPKSKRARFDACLDRMLEAWAEAEAGVRTPWQRPHPPLAVAAFGPLGLAQAARRALPYLPSPIESTKQLAENLAAHRAGLPPDVDPASLVVPVMRTVHVAEDELEADRVLDLLRRDVRGLRGPAARTPRAIARAVGEDVEERAIVGTAQKVVDSLGVLRERFGIDLVVASSPFSGLDASERADALERLAEAVVPALA